MSVLLYLLVILLAALPAVIHRITKEVPARPLTSRPWLVGACIFTVTLLTVFAFHDGRLEPAQLPQKNPLLWYILWGVLMLVHWFVWFAAMVTGKDPTSMKLPFVLPCLLLCAVGLAQGNWLLTGILVVYAVAALIREGVDPA